LRKLHTLRIHGVLIFAYDGTDSATAARVYEELRKDEYGIETIGFQPGDVAIDIGAHVGLVSIYLAKRWPLLKIYAYEPHPDNHSNCADNLRLNRVTNVCLYRRAVTSDRRQLMLQMMHSNTGGASAVFHLPGAGSVGPLEAVTLDDIFESAVEPDGRCRLLKVDCEGLEYEILPSAVSKRVDFFAAEFHEGVLGVAASRGAKIGRPDALREACAGFFSSGAMRIVHGPKGD
jgi:FkbM family methyltransferase